MGGLGVGGQNLTCHLLAVSPGNVFFETRPRQAVPLLWVKAPNFVSGLRAAHLLFPGVKKVGKKAAAAARQQQQGRQQQKQGSSSKAAAARQQQQGSSSKAAAARQQQKQDSSG
ncbi:hypothetical protein DIPPA_03464 [Diplonema papillatum]|nr:hypothetical protein DIPPA_03464 [Diplonema papillatum]